MTDALVLSGGVAKGAFEAGALSVLLGAEGAAAAHIDVQRIVATSSGAVNGAFAASVLHAGVEQAEIVRLGTLWIEEASFGQVFEPSLAGILERSGASNEERIVRILRRAIAPAAGVAPIDLRIVVASLAGTIAPLGGTPATTYERVLAFDGTTFESTEGLEAMFRAVTASAAFPGAFTPVPLELDGRTVPCVDGGAVNNTPLGYALERGADIDRVFVVSPQPRVPTETRHDEHGFGLITHLADMLVEERLYRDLRNAYESNAALARLAKAVPDEGLRAQVLDALGWSGRKPVAIVEIRPGTDLPGGTFDAFFSRDLREQYVASGKAAARTWLANVSSA
jgi:predicted acylesterase/phospholipase RssA